jgi:hypothetical protein
MGHRTYPFSSGTLVVAFSDPTQSHSAEHQEFVGPAGYPLVQTLFHSPTAGTAAPDNQYIWHLEKQYIKPAKEYKRSLEPATYFIFL